MNDDDIQRRFENLSLKEIESLPAENNDMYAYKMLFTNLSVPPVMAEDINLGKHVINILQKRKEQQESIRYSILISLIFLSGITGIVISLLFMQHTIIDQLVNVLRPLILPIIFGCCCLGAVQLLDKTLLKKKYSI